MLALLVWLAGVVFGLWCIWHWGFYREAAAFAVCASVMLWIVGGAAWIGQKLKLASATRGIPPSGDPLLRGLNREPIKSPDQVTEQRRA